MLESERTDSARLAAQYGFSGPENVLRALRRDSLWAQTFHLENVYEKPIAEVLKPYGETIRHHMVLIMKLNELNVLLTEASHAAASQKCHFAPEGLHRHIDYSIHRFSMWTGLLLTLITTKCLCFEGTPALLKRGENDQS